MRELIVRMLELKFGTTDFSEFFVRLNIEIAENYGLAEVDRVSSEARDYEHEGAKHER